MRLNASAFLFCVLFRKNLEILALICIFAILTFSVCCGLPAVLVSEATSRKFYHSGQHLQYTVMGENIDHSSYNSHWCNLSGYSIVMAKFGNEQHLLCLRMVPIGSTQLTRVSRVYLDPDPDEKLNNVSPVRVSMASGFPLVAPSSGSAEGYIGQDGQFYGVLHLGNRTLYADPYNRDDPTKTFGPFEDELISTPRKRREYAQVASHVVSYVSLLDLLDNIFSRFVTDDVARPEKISVRNVQRRTEFVAKPLGPEMDDSPLPTARARICDLLLLADKEFFEKDANGSLNHAVGRMVHAVAQADVIFRNADFDEDGMPDNIGFSVKFILVLASDNTNSRVFGDIRSSRTVDGRSYLMRFSRLRRLSEVCLGIAFSGHSFQNRTLGLSFTSLGGGLGGAAGGLCDRRAFGRSFNTLAIAHATGNGDERVPERIASLTLAHEIGHSFGAHHDDNFPNPLCRGFLMGAQSTTADNPTHFEFSLCSKRLIAATLNTMSHCLYEEVLPYCGNGIVEEDEACDCGLPVRCVYSDPCCTPRTGGAEHFEEGSLHKGGCEVSPTSQCHPSQGPCCTKNCYHANLTKFGIDCKTLGQECSCSNPSCHCGLGGRCFRDGSCHAAECAAQGLRECQCTPQGMGGKLQEARMCGACCVVPGAPERCVAAEVAARARRDLRQLSWLRHDYEGPTLSIQLCANCTPTMVRAWPISGVCVTQNTVGECSPRGICVVSRVPKFNVYPERLSAALMRQKGGTSASWKQMPASLLNFILMFIMVK